MTARFVAYQCGQAAATSSSVASGPRWRRAMLQRESPRWTTTCAVSEVPPEVTSRAALTDGWTGRDGVHPGTGSDGAVVGCATVGAVGEGWVRVKPGTRSGAAPSP